MEQHDLDVVIATDCRLPGGTAVSVAEEITAQWSAGLRTGLVHVPSHLVAGDRPFNERLRRCLADGAAELVVGTDEVRCGALVVRQPQILAGPVTTALPPIHADRRLMVANHTPTDRSGRRRFYDPAAVNAALERRFGGDDWTWAPIGPNVRDALDATAWTPPMLERDWVNVIDVDRWAVERTAASTEPILLGRHGRDLWDKWPSTADDLLAAYPERAGFEVHVLGGAETAELLIGRRPSNWVVHPYGAVRPEDFLAGIDFFVYHPHPDSIEAFGRTVLEALASGAVAVLPERFRRLFGDAAHYGEPDEVASTLEGLAADPDAYRDAVERGRTAARERFSHETHLRRLEPLIGRAVPAERRRTSTSPPPTPPPRPTWTTFPATASPGQRTAAGPLTAVRHRLRRLLGALARAAKALYAALPEPAKRRLRPLVRAAPDSLTRRGDRIGWPAGERPTVLFVLLDLEDDVAHAATAIARLEVVTAAFDAVVVTTAEDTSPLERHGLTVERLDAGRSDGADQRGDRLRELVATYRPVHTVSVHASGHPLAEPWLADLLISLRSS